MSFRFDAMTAPQQEALRLVAAIDPPPAMYLAGGAAVALHCGHRRSIDLDWFSQGALGDPMQLAERLADAGIAWVTDHIERGTLHGRIQGVKVSFLEYRYHLLQPLLDEPIYKCAVASVEDLAAMKLLAVTQRGAKKDFLDVYALHGRLELNAMLACYRRKFSVDDISRVLCALCYFDDADGDPMPEMLVETDWQDVKQTIRDWVRQVAGEA